MFRMIKKKYFSKFIITILLFLENPLGCAAIHLIKEPQSGIILYIKLILVNHEVEFDYHLFLAKPISRFQLKTQ